MKNWFAQWFGGAARRGGHLPTLPAPASVRTTAVDPATAPSEATPGGDDIDLAFYRWLAAGASGDADPATERRILDALARLAQAPAEAAELVPRVPAVIPELLRGLRDESVAGAELSRMVAQDVVLVAEVIREANSPYYRPPSPVRSIEGAVMLLGQNGLRMLLARVAFRPVINMQSGRFAKMVAPQVWSQSEKCAQAASSLAPYFGAKPFDAYLAGLVQNVGLIVAFRLIDQLIEKAGSEDLLPDSSAFGAAVLVHARRISHGIALEWGFPDSVADAIDKAALPGSSAGARVLGVADRLAKLRLLVDAGAIAPDDHLLVTHIGPRLLPVFEQLRPQET